MPHPLVRKLLIYATLDDGDRRVLERLPGTPRTYRAGEDLIQEGQRPDAVFVMVEGWAAAYKMLPDGQRQILAFLLPGDTSDVFNFVLDAADHSIAALSRCKVSTIAQSELADAMAAHPAIARALYWTTQVDSATLREWVLNVGQRGGMARAAHLFTELLLRLRAIGLADGGGDGHGDGFAMPLTQTDLADTMGLTPVYVNRMLQQMRAEGLITLERRHLTIHRPERLVELSAFTPGYLHLERRGEERAAAGGVARMD